MTDLAERHENFEALHRSGCFVIPNPWDAGSARLMAAAGAKALATTSAGFAFTKGRPDMGSVSRDEALAHAAEILAATPLPVTGRSLKRPFVLCARAAGLMNGHYDTAEAIRRARAFEAAGADLLYVPMPPSLDDLAQIVQSLARPVNALAAGPFAKFRKADFERIGIRRISVGSAIARLTHAAILAASTAALEDGDFSPLLGAAKGAEIDALLARGAGMSRTSDD